MNARVGALVFISSIAYIIRGLYRILQIEFLKQSMSAPGELLHVSTNGGDKA